MTYSHPFKINHHLSLPDIVEWVNLCFTWKSFTLIRWEIDFFTLVHVADLRVPQTLLAPLTISLHVDTVAFSLLGASPVSLRSWEGVVVASGCRRG